MKTTEFNHYFKLDQKSCAGFCAPSKHAAPEHAEIVTTEGASYDSSQTYISSIYKRRKSGNRLGWGETANIYCAFGLKVFDIFDRLLNRQTIFEVEHSDERGKFRQNV